MTEDKAAAVRGHMGLLDLPREVLDGILRYVHSDSHYARRDWAIQASTISKAFHGWVLPAVWERLELSERTFARIDDLQPGHKQSKRDIWKYMAKELGPKVAPCLKVLVVDGTELSTENYGDFQELLFASSNNLVALGLGNHNLARHLREGLPQKRSFLSSDDDSDVGDEVPWRKDPRSMSIPALLAQDAAHQATVFPRLERIVLMDTGVGMTDQHYSNLFLDPHTGESVCPNLISLCLIICCKRESVDIDDKFVDAMVSFRARHKHLCHLELHFQHDHYVETTREAQLDLPCGFRVQRQYPFLKELVKKAHVSVTLHSQAECGSDVYDDSRPFHSFEHIDRHNTLNLIDRAFASTEALWEYKINKLGDWCQDGGNRTKMAFDKDDVWPGHSWWGIYDENRFYTKLGYYDHQTHLWNWYEGCGPEEDEEYESDPE